MLAGIHFFVGSSLALSSTSNYFSAFLIGFISHHLLDFLPHLDLNVLKRTVVFPRDYNIKIWFLILSEFCFFIILTLYFLKGLDFKSRLLSFWGGFGAIFPDLISIFFRKFFSESKILKFYLNFHKRFHYQLKNKSYFLPIIFEILVFLLSLLLFLGY